MAKQVSLKDATVTIVMEYEGMVHLIAMEKDKHGVIVDMIKTAVTDMYPTGISQKRLVDFLMKSKAK